MIFINTKNVTYDCDESSDVNGNIDSDLRNDDLVSDEAIVTVIIRCNRPGPTPKDDTMVVDEGDTNVSINPLDNDTDSDDNDDDLVVHDIVDESNSDMYNYEIMYILWITRHLRVQTRVIP